MAFSRLQLRDNVRRRLGWSATDTFVTDAALNDYINESLAELHSLLVTVYRTGQWGTVVAGTTVLAGTRTAPIAFFSDFGRLVNVLMIYNEREIPLEPGDVTIDVVSLLPETYTPWNVRYYLSIDDADSAINFSRPTIANQTILLTYIKAPPVLNNDGESSWMGWDEYVVLDVCLKCAAAEEDDVSTFANQKNALQARIRQQAEPLDMGRAATVQDTRALDETRGNADESWWWRRWG